MEKFIRLTGVAASLMEDNIDTDIIFPARFLLLTARDGLGRYAFNDRRFDADGRERLDFVLNRAPWRGAQILVTGANFGSGSSREQAVWALLGQGIRCVIAPSFGEIFLANCFRNGVLPIALPDEQVAELARHADAARSFVIDLEAQQISVDAMPPVAFTVAAEPKQALLNGWDETALILNAYGDDIATFESVHRHAQPWLFEAGASQ